MNAEPMVYVIDDDAEVLASLEAILSVFGYQVKCFSSAETFLASVSLDCCGCVLTDLNLPRMNGLQLHAHVRQSQSVLSVIVVTGAVSVGGLEDQAEGEPVTFATKPFALVDLKRAVEQAMSASLERQQLRDAA